MNDTARQPAGMSGNLGAGEIRVLHLEDSPVDAELVKYTIEQGGFLPAMALAASKTEFEKALDNAAFDVILCDHGIPGYDGFAAIQFAQIKQPHVPIIILSGTLDDIQAVESLKRGATDYVLKHRLERLVPSIRRALKEAEDRRMRQAAEERIREQAELLNLTHDAIIVRDLEDRIILWNKGAEAVLGWSREEVMTQGFGALLSPDVANFKAANETVMQTGDWLGELQLKSKTGKEIIVFSRWSLLKGNDGQPRAILSANTDVTETKKLEAISLRAQRMDSIGALAGGIAHDLNNALAPVLMSADLLRSCDDDESRRQYIEIITSGSRRATGMVKQILGFARGKGLQASPVMPGHLVREMAKMVRETFPKTITVNSNIPKDGWHVLGDPTELHQILLNLCVNARDAMPNGGHITMSVQNVLLGQETAGSIRLKAGPCVLLSVADTGTGIAPEVLPRIFEPFFTTKTPEIGTGLGLSTVASIVKHHKGALDIKTEPGRGTEFRIYLPALESSDAAVEATPASLPSGRGQLVMIMDDEQVVRELTKSTLETCGYKVITAQDGVHGILCFEENKDNICLVISDTDMPVLDGLTAISTIKRMRPDIPVIVASGGPRNAEEWDRLGRITQLGKPYNVEQLLAAVAGAIN